jgi:O-antigen/teichoic acid export membrane protein
LHPLVKKLAGQTAVYGLSSILGRLLNYLLVPLHTRIFDPAAYGVVTEFYAYASFLAIVFTYGMETAFFRYTTLEENKKKVYDTALASLLVSTLTLVTLLIVFAQPIADLLRYPDQSEYIIWFCADPWAGCIGCHSFCQATSGKPARKIRNI